MEQQNVFLRFVSRTTTVAECLLGSLAMLGAVLLAGRTLHEIESIVYLSIKEDEHLWQGKLILWWLPGGPERLQLRWALDKRRREKLAELRGE